MSLFDDIKNSAEGRELSARWYRNKISALGGNQMTAAQHISLGQVTGNIQSRPTYGMMNLYRYHPKYDKKYKYYDIYPLVLPIKNVRDGFVGLNFHYLSIPYRVKLLDDLKIFESTDGTRLDATYSRIRTGDMIKPVIKRYNNRFVQSMFLRIPFEDMLTAILLPVQRFYNGPITTRRAVSERVVHRDSRSMI